jgi:hypothetical protein
MQVHQRGPADFAIEINCKPRFGLAVWFPYPAPVARKLSTQLRQNLAISARAICVGRDCLADGAVCCEPVSASKFPDLQGKNREIHQFRSGSDVPTRRKGSGYRCFSIEFPKIQNRDCFSNSREVQGDIRELSEVIRVLEPLGKF